MSSLLRILRALAVSSLLMGVREAVTVMVVIVCDETVCDGAVCDETVCDGTVCDGIVASAAVLQATVNSNVSG